jgi:hypothetical protein
MPYSQEDNDQCLLLQRNTAIPPLDKERKRGLTTEGVEESERKIGRTCS